MIVSRRKPEEFIMYESYTISVSLSSPAHNSSSLILSLHPPLSNIPECVLHHLGPHCNLASLPSSSPLMYETSSSARSSPPPLPNSRDYDSLEDRESHRTFDALQYPKRPIPPFPPRPGQRILFRRDRDLRDDGDYATNGHNDTLGSISQVS